MKSSAVDEAAKPILKCNTGYSSHFQSVFEIARFSNSSRFPWNNAFSVVIIRDLPKRLGRARKKRLASSLVISLWKYAVLSTYTQLFLRNSGKELESIAMGCSIVVFPVMVVMSNII